MITTSVAQYLHPDYLPPLPTTLDAKKSPLALLAQTCSSIGKEPSNTKSIIPPLDKKENEKSNEKSSSEAKRDQKNKEDSSDKPGFRTVSQTHKDIPPLVPVSTSKEEKSSSPPIYKTSPKPKDSSGSLASTSSHTEGNSSFSRSIHSRTPGSRHSSGDTDEDRNKRPVSSPLSPTKTSRENGYNSENIRSSIPSSYSYSSLSSGSSTYPHFTHAGHGLSADALAAAQFSGYPLPLPAHGAFGSSSAAAAALAAQSSALSAQSSALKSAYGSSLSPYVTYARVRTPSGATTLVPVCRDPYCTHCQLTLQNSHLSATCTAVGCAQCAHEKTLQNLSLGLQGSSYSHYPPSLSASSLLSSVPSNLSNYSLASLYPSSLLSAHTQTGMSFACNWVSPGNEPCGKRFTTSEELLQHLRTHTTVSDPLSLAMYERYGLPGTGLSGLHGHLPTHGSISPNSLRRNYPTSLSPLGGLMGSSRYHPYKSLITPPSALSSSQQLPSFGPYLSPYSVYGQRIGAAAVP